MIRLGTVVRRFSCAVILMGLAAPTAAAGRISGTTQRSFSIGNLWSRAVDSIEQNVTATADKDTSGFRTFYDDVFPPQAAKPPLSAAQVERIRAVEWRRYQAFEARHGGSTTRGPEAQVIVPASVPATSFATAPAASAGVVMAVRRRSSVAEAQVLIAPQTVPEPSGALIACAMVVGAVARRRRRAA